VRRLRAAFSALAALAAFSALACNPDDVVHRSGWFATMRHQRSFKPYSRPLAPVAGTVPVTGVQPTADLKSADRLANARTRTSESLNRGKFAYETYCLVCHGETGKGDGPIASGPPGGFFPAVRSLVTDDLARRSDGYLYGVIVNPLAMGRGLMPAYGDKVRGTDRWDLVNYLRSLQAQARGGASR
jgi:mono/diheme cytochrome c family protein